MSYDHRFKKNRDAADFETTATVNYFAYLNLI